jgi:WD40 repeat protein
MRLWRFHSWDTVATISKLALTQDDILSKPSLEMKQANSSAEEQVDVTSIEWNPEGTFLASGCFDGTVRMWSTDGDVILHKKGHNVN